MCGRSLHVHGCTFSEPRSALAHSEHRDRAESAPPWCVFFGYLSLHKLHKQRKVTRPSAGRAEALHFKKRRKIKMDSSSRWNDEKKGETEREQTHPHPRC
jgi:hypothetical protein